MNACGFDSRRFRKITDKAKAMEKICTRCGKSKELREFRLNNRTKDGYTAACKECLNRKQNKDKANSINAKGVSYVPDLPNEIWRPIPTLDGYKASSLGRIKAASKPVVLKGGVVMSNERILKQQSTYQGYLSVIINGSPRFVHRLVALAFIPNPGSLPCVNHKDENKANPKLENLEWCDIQYNTNYGTAPERRARKRGRPVLQFTVDGDLVAEYYSMGVAAKSIGVKSAGNICMCCKGQRPVAYGYVWKYKMDIL